MKKTYFIADLHLSPARPEITTLFISFLHQSASDCEALYILGDLFEYWIGDDDPTLYQEVIDALSIFCKEQKIPTFFIHGNRDFLIGNDFAQTTGIQLLAEQTVIDLYGTPTLIMHGDTLCTDDIGYQTLRLQLRDPMWQKQFLALPLENRHAQAQELREKSKLAMQGKSTEIMDVNQEAVAQTLQQQQVVHLIHGHTHRPATHHFTVHDQQAERIVLGDWYQQGSVLKVDATEKQLLNL